MLLDICLVVLIAHFTRLTLRAIFMARHQAYDSTSLELAQGLGLTKMIKRQVPTNKEATEFTERDVQVANPEAVSWRTRLRVLGAQFLTN